MEKHYLIFSLDDITEFVEGVGTVTETWKDVAGYEGIYKISNFGRVKSLKRYLVVPEFRYNSQRVLPEFIRKQSTCKFGYQRISLSKNAKQKRFYVHVLVALHFIPNTENKKQVNHKKCVKWYNRVWDLEWCTAKENNDHARDNGISRGFITDNSCNKKLSENDILYIYNSKESYKILCEKFGVSKFPISGIKTGLLYSDLTGKVYKRKRRM